jgi:glycine cleavage system aminomethyltransferase T
VGAPSFAVKLDKGDLIGRDAVLADGERGLERRQACPVLDDPRSVTLGLGAGARNGEVVARVTTGGDGYAVARSVA